MFYLHVHVRTAFELTLDVSGLEVAGAESQLILRFSSSFIISVLCGSVQVPREAGECVQRIARDRVLS